MFFLGPLRQHCVLNRQKPNYTFCGHQPDPGSPSDGQVLQAVRVFVEILAFAEAVQIRNASTLPFTGLEIAHIIRPVRTHEILPTSGCKAIENLLIGINLFVLLPVPIHHLGTCLIQRKCLFSELGKRRNEPLLWRSPCFMWPPTGKVPACHLAKARRLVDKFIRTYSWPS